MTILDVQTALKVLGFDPGPLDDAWGRRSSAALKRWQGANRLEPTGVLTPAVVSALGAAVGKGHAPPPDPPWYGELRRHLGLREVAGARHSPTILTWLAKLKAAWRDDETAWCGTAVGYAVALTLPEEPLPSNPFGARSWLGFGVPLARPSFGAVAVFWRGSRDGWQGHVGLYAGERADAIRVLGGNQGDAVSEAWLARDRLLGFRWPRTYPLPTSGAVQSAAAGVLSTNEA